MLNRFFFMILISVVLAGCSSARVDSSSTRNGFHVPENWDKPINKQASLMDRETPSDELFKPDFSASGTKSSTTGSAGFQPEFSEPRKKPEVSDIAGEQMTGEASWYGPGFHGKLTANGERYNQNELTAAHKILPMNTWVKVTNLENNRAVVVRINDRGPYKKNRIIDLTKAAAEKLGFREKGTTDVTLKVLQYPEDYDPSEGLVPYKQVVVQIAVFKGEKRAYSFKDQLQRKYQRIPFMIDVKKETGFHVVAGPYDSRDDAKQIAQALKKEGIDNFIRSYKK